MQRSCSRGAVWHSALALSVQLEAFAHGHHQVGLHRSLKVYSLQHHGQCLKEIQQSLKDGLSPANQVDILLTAFLVISFELLRGNDAVALAHLEGALSILHETTTVAYGSREDEDILSALNAIYTRLELHALTFVGERVPTRSIAQSKPANPVADKSQSLRRVGSMPNLRLLSDRLTVLEYRGHQAMRLDRAAIAPTLADLRHWYTFFEFSSVVDGDHNEIGIDPMDCYFSGSGRILHIRYMIIYMRLSAFLEASETAFDEYQDSFAVIIQHAEAIVSTTNQKMFTMEMELIEPLYFTILKCREPR
ncbi:hypothetical protein EK21DRAFT_87459 [Setomelanomma holmii]|uniref:Uncharacterized protein n=1 Tax=Setomelanomma holmii TaxID=210430 RepID=A0A9P4HEB8_9PLEO|nr:hypothetical protein EK21DRAFT_87459 [Setomelanomma holmii]